MRMRRRNNLAPRMAACEPVWIHEPEALRGNWRSLMTGCRELRVEVGCGKGKFTVETAAQEPDFYSADKLNITVDGKVLDPSTTIRWRKGLGAASMRAPASTPISSVFTSSNSGR